MNGPRDFKDAAYEQLARVGKALASARRLEILDALAQAPHTVEDLARATGMSVANCSRHLQVLRTANLVVSSKAGLYVTYRLANERTHAFVAAFHALADDRLAELQRLRDGFLGSADLETVGAEELADRARAGAVTVVDVRPRSEYRAGHLPGAISVPIGELEAQLDRIPRDRPVVAYCRGPYCAYAAKAVELLRAYGLDATRIEQGVAQWRAAGISIDGAA